MKTMPEIQLPNGLKTVVDQADIDLRMFHWSVIKNKYGTKCDYRALRHIPGANKKEYLHRVILERIVGRKLSSNEFVDHINHDPLDNRRSNLRIATLSQNSANSTLSQANTTGYKGVSRLTDKPRPKPFIAFCRGKYLGTFATAEEAHGAYCEAAKERWGEFANPAHEDGQQTNVTNGVKHA